VSGSKIPELETIEFTGAASIAEYSRAGRRHARDLAGELHSAAEEVKAVLSAQKGNPLLMGVDVRLRARKVARRLERAAELADGMALEIVRFNAEFRVQFADVIRPTRRGGNARRFNWSE
jgi:hypothetical protein